MCHYSLTPMCHHHHVCQPSLPLSHRSRVATRRYSLLPFLAYSSLTGQHHGPFTHPTYHILKALITVWPTILSLHALLLHAHSSLHLLFLVSHTYLPTYLPSHPYTPSLDPTVHQQTQISNHARAKTYRLKYSLPPPTLSLSLPRRRLGRTPLVAVLLFLSCCIRALFSCFVSCRWMRQWSHFCLPV